MLRSFVRVSSRCARRVAHPLQAATQTARFVRPTKLHIQQVRSIVFLFKRVRRPSAEDIPKPVENPAMAQNYHDQIVQLVSADKLNDAIKKWDEMRLAGILPTAATFKVALSVFDQKGEAEGLLEAFNEFKAAGYPVDQVIRNILLDMYMKRGDLLNAERTFAEMKQTEAGADLYAYHRVLDMYIMTRKKQRAEAIVSEMKAKGMQPDSGLLEKLTLVK